MNQTPEPVGLSDRAEMVMIAGGAAFVALIVFLAMLGAQ